MHPRSSRSRRIVRLTITACILSGLLCACGQMGPLYQPPPDAEQAPAQNGGAAR